MEASKTQTGKIIRTLRKNKNMTQEELGNLLNVKNNTVSGYEKGLVYPSIEALLKLAEIFKCSTDELLCVENSNIIDGDWFYIMNELKEKGYTPFQLSKLIETQENVFKIMGFKSRSDK